MSTTLFFPASPLRTGGPARPRPGEAAADDFHLMERSRRGDREAYGLLFDRFSERIRRTAFLMLHDSGRADDVVQETFAKGLVSLGTFRGEGPPRAWFLTIAVNLCRHILRGAKQGADGASPDTLEEGRRLWRSRTRGVATGTILRESITLLSIALGYLSDAQREVFVLHYRDELPYEEIGQILGIRPGAARALAHRARIMLRKKLGDRFAS